MKKLLLPLLCIPSLLFAQYEAGTTYFGTDSYTEYNAGSLLIIVVAPHGGKLKPNEIPDRDCDGCVVNEDFETQQLSRLIDSALFNLTVCHPHVIINKLHRSKLDANREVIEATDSTAASEVYWSDFHNFVEAAKATVTKNFGKGLIIDMHGHGHP